MSNNKIKIDICVATYKRPLLLERNIVSILKQKLRDDIEFRVIVIDNDILGSAKEIVNKISKETDVEIIYDIEPRQNIALARNKGFSHVDAAEYFVCVDDDEHVVDTWLISLLESLERYNADVVFGPVEEILPDGTPSWIVEGGYFKRNTYEDGFLLKHGGTGNVLIKSSILDAQPFNESFGLTGGSDTELFHKLYQQGFKLIWCNRAIAMEEVMEKRLNLKWLLMRAYRGGQVFIRVYSVYWSKLYLLYWYLTRLSYAFVSIFLSILFLPIRKSKSIFYLRKFMSNIGQLTGKWGFSYKEYLK